MPRTAEQKKRDAEYHRERRKRKKAEEEKRLQKKERDRIAATERKRKSRALKKLRQQEQELMAKSAGTPRARAPSNPDDLATPRPSGTLGLDSAAATVAGIEAIERMTQSQRDHEAEQRKHELEVLDKKIKLETAKKASAKKPRVSANNIRKVDRKLDVDSSDEEDDGDYAKATSIINNNGNDSDEDEITASDTDDDEDEDPPTSTASNSSDFVVGDKIKWTKSVQCTIVRVNKKSYRVTYTNPWTGENQKDSFALKGKYEKHSTVLVKFTSRGVITSVADDEIGLDITCNNEAIETYAQKAEWHEIVKIVPPPAPPSNAKRISQWQRKPTHYS